MGGLHGEWKTRMSDWKKMKGREEKNNGRGREREKVGESVSKGNKTPFFVRVPPNQNYIRVGFLKTKSDGNERRKDGKIMGGRGKRRR